MDIKQNNKILYPRGSEWRKWDLHIHSPLSLLNNRYPKLPNGDPDWESFIAKLESLDDIAVIGITDYFTIDGYKKLNEFKEQGRLSNIHTILPNIEFRLNSVISSKKDGQKPRRLNFHVIFSDEVSEKDVEEHFLHDLHFFYEGNPQDKDDARKLKCSNIEDLGKKLINEHQKFRDSGLSPLQIGAMQTVVSHEDITKCLEDKRFKGKYIQIFPEELSNLIDWDGQDHHIRKGLLQKCDMVFSSNERTRLWCLGQDPYSEGVKKFIEEFKTCKPCIHGSDAHKLAEIAFPCALRGEKEHKCKNGGEDCDLRYCWIKADPTFEGLKQLLYEPQERVVIQQKNPTPVKSSYTFNNFKISQATINEDLSISETEIDFNSGLVAVIGSKGSGKTALVDLIANSFQDRCNTKDPNSFVRRITDHKPDLKTTITFEDTNQFTKSVCDPSFFQDSEIIYIAQGELEQYIGENSDLDVYVNNLIFESPQVKDTVISFEFNELTETIKESETSIEKKNELIITLENQTTKENLNALDLGIKQTQADLKDVEKRLKNLEMAQSKEKIALAQEKQTKISNLKLRKEDLTNLKTLLTDAITFIDNDLTSFNANIEAINVLLKKLGIEEQFDSISYKQRTDLDNRLSLVKSEIIEIVKSIEFLQKELETFEAGVREHAKLLNRKQELNSDIHALETKINEFHKKQDLLTQANKDRKSLLMGLFETIVFKKKKYEEIIDAFSAQKAEVLSDLNFGGKIDFDRKRFIQTAEDVMDNRRVDVSGKDSTSITYQLFILIESIISGKEDEIPKLVEEIEKINKENKSKLKTSQAITVSDFYQFLYGNYCKVVPTIKYKNIPLSKLSLGQKATVLIKIYLAQGDKPIIIDSHDDHLDNEFIMDELVKAIRQAKTYRQVILVSNNGNVVINSDAEQIVIAKREGTSISYISGSIENPMIRNRAVKVLEGGSEAFRRRQQKYRLNY
jgi:energy-coupling factor transporter ATP-binding protein EcfA2